MPVAKRSDWETVPMPAQSERISLRRRYSSEEFERIKAGLIPQDMDDHWFIYYEEPWLYLHRSWTGFCIFQVRFEALDDGVVLAEATVNTSPEQYQDPEADRWLGILLDSQAGRDTRAEALDLIRDRGGGIWRRLTRRFRRRAAARPAPERRR
jgi:hypothetical protein